MGSERQDIWPGGAGTAAAAAAGGGGGVFAPTANGAAQS